MGALPREDCSQKIHFDNGFTKKYLQNVLRKNRKWLIVFANESWLFFSESTTRIWNPKVDRNISPNPKTQFESWKFWIRFSKFVYVIRKITNQICKPGICSMFLSSEVMNCSYFQYELRNISLLFLLSLLCWTFVEQSLTGHARVRGLKCHASFSRAWTFARSRKFCAAVSQQNSLFVKIYQFNFHKQRKKNNFF